MSNYIIPPQLKASDYAKGKLTQNEIISLQIANDANISKARKAFKMGEVAEISQQGTTPEELIMDIAAQEASARANLEKLGFRPQEASQIISAIRIDNQLDFTQLNTNFPAIETDIRKRFNVKLLTPTFFVEYFRRYSDELLNVAGVRIFNGRQNANNELINNVPELRSLIPDAELINFIGEAANRVGIISIEDRNQLNRLSGMLPSNRDLRELENMDAVSQQRIIQDLLDQFSNLPSRVELETLAEIIQGRNSNRLSQGIRNEILALIDAVPVGVQENIVEDAIGGGYRVGDDDSIVRDAIRNNIDPRTLTQSQQRLYFAILSGRDVPEVSLEGVEPAPQLSIPTRATKAEKASSSIPTRTTGESFASAVSRETPASAIRIDSSSLKEIKEAFKMYPDLVPLLRGPDGNVVKAKNLTLDPNVARLNDKKVFIDDTNIRQIFQDKFGRGLPKRPIAPKIRMKVGRGIAVKQTPSYREYGKYAIHLPQLEQQDILNVKYKSLGQIPKFKPVPVSDIFRDYMIDLLENGKPNARVYNQIPEEERKLFEEISIGAGVWNGLGLKRTTTSTDEEENKRFELLKGEYMAGNNSQKVIGSLRQLVVKMMNDGRIRRNQGVDLLMELSI